MTDEVKQFSLFGDDFALTNETVKAPKETKTKKIKVEVNNNISQGQLFEDDGFIIKPQKVSAKDINKKIKTKKEIDLNIDPEKLLKSKKLTLEDRLTVINTNVLKVLGKQRENVLVIRDLDTFSAYIDKAIEKGRIAIDTETNNSLDPITCKLMGLCLYVSGEKQAYIPINHINNSTGELLENQLTEADCRNQLQRVIDNKVMIIMHNGKFDYKVIKCTCGIEVKPNWDTLIASKLINENEHSAGLKQQYISKIDPTQEKYSIDHLFNNVEYAQVDPDIFALYAATDSMMTDKLYEYQKPIIESYKNEPGPLGKTIYDLFMEVEMPCIISTAEMELNGILFDNDYAKRLKVKFEDKLASIDAKIQVELDNLRERIAYWRTTNEATFHPTKKSGGEAKSKSEQLEDPINLGSPTQLAILFYDVLKFPAVDSESPRGTGEEVLKLLKEKTPLAGLLLERRGTVKLLDAFINSLPENINPKTGKIHGSFNQYGAATGRFSSSEPNLQQIPSHMKSIRMLFKADCPEHKVELTDNFYIVPFGDEVETNKGWKKVKDLVMGDTIIGDSNIEIIKDIKIVEDKYVLYV